MPATIKLFADRDPDPSFTDAVFFDVGSFRSIEANTNFTLQNFFIVVGARWIDAEPVW